MKNSILFGLVAILIVFTARTGISQDIGSSIPDINKNIQKDQYGRIIKNGEQTINYEYSDKLRETTNSNFQNKDLFPLQKDETYCDPVWKQGIMGTCIGVNSMTSADLDNDGVLEIICSGGGGFGSGRFWYILQFNPSNQEYEQKWISPFYPDYEQTISCITAIDLIGDEKQEIICGFHGGEMLFYDSESMTVYQSIQTDAESIFSIKYADADNDNQMELVFCDEENTFLYNPVALTFEHTIYYGSRDMEVGNVDANSDNEIVLSSGKVLRFDGNNTTIIWTFPFGVSYNGFVELSDIDSDNMQEIIHARSWQYITVYDADIQSPKYQIESDLDIDALLVTDVNDDGIDEILYGDGQWGDIYCHNAVTQGLMWSVNNPEHGVTEINVADVDNDGTKEVLWGAGCSSTGSDHLFIHEIPSGNFEWQSKHLDGPFYAVEVADVDDDGDIETVTISYESNSGYDSGIISIFDANDGLLEWQCSGNYLGNIWTGVYTIEIQDIDQDSETEIIIASGDTYDGKIWIINGATHEIESSYEFYAEDLDEFYALDVVDVDDDGQIECVVGEGGYLHVIDPSNYSIEWSSVNLGYAQPRTIRVDNINSNSNKEIIACFDHLYIFDGITHQQWQSTTSGFRDFDLYDIDNNTIKDIVACKENGEIVIIDGETLETNVLVDDFSESIDAIKVVDISGDPLPELVFTSNGRIYFRTLDGNQMETQTFGTVAGAYSGMAISDHDNNGKFEVFAGTNFQVVELNENCYNCISFNIELQGEDISCIPGNDGVVEVMASGGEEPYTYMWSFGGTNSIETGLQPGNYSVTVSDNKGCTKTGEITILQSEIVSSYISTRVGCTGINNGSAEVAIIEGHPPYAYIWSNGATTSQVTGLSVGDYSVNISDAKYCEAEHNITIEKDTVIVDITSYDINCYGDENGYAQLYILEGVAPFSVQWSNGSTSSTLTNLPEGTYSVVVNDDLMCEANGEIIISEPPELLLSSMVTPDDPNTIQGEGSAMVIATGGSPPYYYTWYDQYYQTNATAINLVAGEYTVKVTDIHNCSENLDVFVPEINGVDENDLSQMIEVYPNPGKDVIYVSCGFTSLSSLNIEMFDIMGTSVKSESFTIMPDSYSLDIADLPAGLYFIKFQCGILNGIKKISKQ
ncbi:MAG: T9SS type A sorting domain-containing protein [Bacteroidales bacterium]